MSDAKLTYYDLLGVSSAASSEEIQNAYRALLVKLHPDISRLDNLDTSRLASALKEAWGTLNDPEKRRAYDDLLKGEASAPAGPEYGERIAKQVFTDERAREYVDQLEKARSFWEAARKRAEQERTEQEKAALVWSDAQASAERVRLAGQQAARQQAVQQVARQPADQVTARQRAPGDISQRAVQPARFPWLPVVLISALVLALVGTAWALLRPLSPSASERAARHDTPKAAVTHARQIPQARHTASGPHNVAATRRPNATQSVVAVRPASTAPAIPVTEPSAPAATQVPTQATTQAVQRNPGCKPASVTSTGDGSVVQTSDGRVYRIDVAYMQQEARTWSVGDRITVCTKTADDGTIYASLDDPSRGTLQATRVQPMTSYGNPPICKTTTLDAIRDEGGTIQTSDGHAYRVNDDEAMRQEARSWGTGSQITVCSTTETNGTVHVSIVGSDTVRVLGTLLKPR